MFEAAFEGAPAIDDPVVADVAVTDPPAAPGPPPLPAAAPDVIDSRAAVSDTEDRVLLQFAATVPHDLAELRRIAADNQW